MGLLLGPLPQEASLGDSGTARRSHGAGWVAPSPSHLLAAFKKGSVNQTSYRGRKKVYS